MIRVRASIMSTPKCSPSTCVLTTPDVSMDFQKNADRMSLWSGVPNGSFAFRSSRVTEGPTDTDDSATTLPTRLFTLGHITFHCSIVSQFQNISRAAAGNRFFPSGI
jgi:hypothetical protein